MPIRRIGRFLNRVPLGFDKHDRKIMSKKKAISAVNDLLLRLRKGDSQALGQLLPLVYEELRRIAHHHMKSENPNHTLQPTAIVNEAFLRLQNAHGLNWQDKTHFFATASRMMRRILTDHARAKKNKKRGANSVRVTFDENVHGPSEDTPDLIALDIAIEKLERTNEKRARIVEMRFYGGMTMEEIAQALNVSIDHAKREWASAKAWLFYEIQEEIKKSG
jgi:RNA polymerase sigma-70 factor (ECF subfamily)